MDAKELRRKVMLSLQEHEPGEKEQVMLGQMRLLNKFLVMVYQWDGLPENLDINSFAMEELLEALSVLEDHQEDESLTSLQRGNACSCLVTAISFASALLELPRRLQEVEYI